MSVLSISHFRKYYGKHPGVKDISLSVYAGEILGFVGPNGAGKSTTIKALMGFIAASGGTASIGGYDVAKDSKAIKQFTGYVPSDVRLYSDMKVRELIERNAGFYAIDCSLEAQRLRELFDVDENKRFHELSTGNKKKVSIVCALMTRPKVIILDEPTNGLDPVMQKKLFAELVERTNDGATVLLSSHNLAEVQAYCHRVAFIKDGIIVAVTDLRNQTPRKIITITGGGEPIPEGLELVSREGESRVLRTTQAGEAILPILMELSPDDFTVENESMEKYFWNLFGLED